MYQIQLDSPYFENEKPAVFNYNSKGNNNEAAELVKIIRYISEDHDELKNILNRNPGAHTGYESCKKLCYEYNEWIINNRPNTLKEYKISNKRASNSLIRDLMVLVYNRSILEPDKLNQYEPFSPEVYGETSFDLIDSLLSRVPLKENENFIDLGSGVGNVVLHVAASSNCKCCYGFEKAEWPALYAVKMEREFKYWMNFFGRTYSKFKIYKGDFFSDEETVLKYNPIKDIETVRTSMNEYVKELINEANLIFVNNYAFGAEVDHQLKLRFCNMLEGSIIVSSKPFCSLNFRINSRNLNDIGTMLNTTEILPLNGKVSWTDRPINYYFHKIDRTLLEKYFNSLKPNSIEPKHRKSTSSLVISTSSGSSQSSAASSPTSSAGSPNSNHSPKLKTNSSLHRRTSTDSRSKSKKKRKNDRSPNNSLNSIQNHKKVRLSKKDIKKTKSAAVCRSKSLDKDVLNTLAKMHKKVLIKTTQIDPNRTDAMNISDSFNIKSMTTLKTENLDKKLLKDCKISPKLAKSLRNEPENRSTDLSNKHKANKRKIQQEDLISRQKLGNNIMNAVDGFLQKMQKQYVKHLMHLKSSEYEESVKLQLKNEVERRNELLQRKAKIEKLTSSLMKSNVDLLKKRAEELGIKNLESPYELIEYARTILTDNKNLNKKIDIMQKKVNCLSFKSITNETKSNGETIGSIEKSNDRLQNLDKLLRKIDSKYTCFNISSEKSKKSLNLTSPVVEYSEYARSADDTLSATEKIDDDDQNLAELDEELTTLEPKIQKKINKITKPSKLFASPIQASGDKYDNILNGNRNSLDSWRSFKIPKQQKNDDTQNSKHNNILINNQTPNGSPTLSTSSSQIATKPIETTIPRQISYESNSSSSSNSFNASNKNIFESTNTADTNKFTSSSSYYHPKKKQFRQYMMENLSSGIDSLSDQITNAVNKHEGNQTIQQ